MELGRIANRMKWGVIGMVLVTAGLMTGCQKTPPNISSSKDSSGRTDDSEATQVVSPHDAPTAESPATRMEAGDELNKEPEQICREFLDALQQGDSMAAGRYLTKAALFETRRAELELEAPGGPGAEFVIGQTFYATAKKEVAQVECIVRQNGQFVSKMFWILKRSNVGWKIAGMAFQPDGEPPQLISFENRQHVQNMQMSLGGTAHHSEMTTQHQEPDSTGDFPGNSSPTDRRAQLPGGDGGQFK